MKLFLQNEKKRQAVISFADAGKGWALTLTARIVHYMCTFCLSLTSHFTCLKN